MVVTHGTVSRKYGYFDKSDKLQKHIFWLVTWHVSQSPSRHWLESPKGSSLLTSVTACRWLAQVSGLPSSDIGLVGPCYHRLSHSKIQYKYCQLTLNIFALDMLDIFRRVERCCVDTEAELPRPTATTATCPASGVCWVERPNNCVVQF